MITTLRWPLVLNYNPEPDEDDMFDINDIVNELNDSLDSTIINGDKESYIADFKSYYQEDNPDIDAILKDIKDIYVDSDYIYLKIETLEIDRKDLIELGCYLLEDILDIADVSAEIEVETTVDVFDTYYNDPSDMHSEQAIYECTVYIKNSFSEEDCNIVKEER